MSAEEYKNMVNRYFDALNNQNLDALDELFVENYVSHENPPRPDGIGVEQFKKFIASFYSSYPDAHFTVEEILIDGDAIAIRWRCEATHTGPTPNLHIPPTGKKVFIIGCTIEHVKNGKFFDEWGFWDQSALLEQLGVLPPT